MSIYRYADADEQKVSDDPASVDEQGNIQYVPPETHDESIDSLPEYQPPQIDRDQIEAETSKESKGGEK